MRHLRHALLEVSRLGKPGPRLQAPARRHVGGLSLSSAREKRVEAAAGVNARRPTGVMEQRRAAEVQKCADKVRPAVTVTAVNVNADNDDPVMTMTMTANAPRRFRAVSGLVPPNLSKYSPRSGWKSALICLGNMRKGGVAPGSAAYNVALKACVGAGEFDRAAALLEDMEGSGATPDADIVREITAAGGDGAGGLQNADESLKCDSGASTAAARAAAAAAVSSGGSRRSMSSLSGRGCGRGSVAGMHTVAVGADIEWPSRRPINDCNARSSSSSSNFSNSDSREDRGELLMSFDPFSLGPVTSSASSMSGSANNGSVAGMHTGADGVWPSRRPASDGGGGEQLHKHQHLHLHHEGGAGVVPGSKLGEAEGSWLSARAAPFAGSWGDD